MSDQQTSAPTPSAEAVAAVNAIFGESTPDTSVPVTGNPPVSAVPQQSGQMQQPASSAAPAHFPAIAQASQQATAPPENPLSPGVAARLAEEANRRRAAEDRVRDVEMRLARYEGQMQGMQTVQQQGNLPPPPDLISETDRWKQHTEQELRQSVSAQAKAEAVAAAQAAARQERWATQAEIVADRVGPELYQQAITAVKSMPEAFQKRLSQEANPHLAAVQWHRQQQVMQVTNGGDLDGFARQIAQRLQTDPAFAAQYAPAQAQQPMQAQRPAYQVPPGNPPPPLQAAPRSVGNGPFLSPQQSSEQYYAQRRAAWSNGRA